MRKLFGLLLLSLSASSIAYAHSAPAPQNVGWTRTQLQPIEGRFEQNELQFQKWFESLWHLPYGDTGQNGRPVAAPEFEVGGALVALTLLGGGLAVIRGRRSK